MTVENFPGGKPVVILGTDGTDLYGVLVDAAGRLQVDLVNLDDIGDIATQTTLAEILTALQIIDGFADEDNVLFGYNDRYAENLSHTMTETATYQMDFTVVTEGEVWVVESIAARDAGTIVRIFLRGRTNAGTLINLADETPAAATNWVLWGGRLVLKYQDHVRITFQAAQDADALEGHVWGYKMKV